MAEHDPLCQADPIDDIYFCVCEFIAKVRADERTKVHVTSTGLSGRTDYAQVRSQVLADLRAQVKSLPAWQPSVIGNQYILRDAMLALLDGRVGSDELPIHRTEAGWPRCSTCDGGGCLDCTDPA